MRQHRESLPNMRGGKRHESDDCCWEAMKIVDEVASWLLVGAGIWLIVWKRELYNGVALLALAKANMAYALAEEKRP